MKRYHETENVGRARYVVTFYNGVKTHADGSPFGDIRIFSNAKRKARFVRELKAQGYREDAT